MDDGICAGIVTYNPEIDLFSQCLAAVKSQVEKVYIFDNGSGNKDQISETLKGSNAFVVFNGENVGIAKALNELCMMAMGDGYKWILTMDQDSICSNDMVKALRGYTCLMKAGIIAPRIEFRNDGILIQETRNRIHDVEKVRACITSGSLTRIEAWKEVGGFDEWMFIDHVDNEFCTHLWVKGYTVIRVNSAVLYQRAGNMNYLSLPFGKKILLPCYSELRNYYICRNTVYYLRKYRKHIKYWHELMSFVYSQLMKVVFEKNRLQTIKSTFKGVRDGIIVK